MIQYTGSNGFREGLPMPALAVEPAFGGVDFDLFCGPAPLRLHHRNLWMKEDFKVGDHGEKGRLKMRRNHFETDPAGLITNGPDATAIGKWEGSGHIARPHLENWLDAIRNGAILNAPVEVGHRSVTICHLANIAREINRPLRWNPEAEEFVADNEANRLLDRPRRNDFELPHA